MKPYADNEAFEWIKYGRKPADPRPEDGKWKGYTVEQLMPDCFEAYVKVFHRLDANYQNIESPLTPEEIAILGIPACNSLRDFVIRHRAGSVDTRVKWRDIAEALQLPLVAGLSDEWCRSRLEPGCWPRYIYGPNEGNLDADELRELTRLLALKLGSEDCFFRLPEIPFSGTNHPLLYQGTLKEILAFYGDNNINTPEYWWPADHEWCVCSDYDLSFTIIGCSRLHRDIILSSEVLEIIEVTPAFRIDIYSPVPS